MRVLKGLLCYLLTNTNRSLRLTPNTTNTTNFSIMGYVNSLNFNDHGSNTIMNSKVITSGIGLDVNCNYGFSTKLLQDQFPQLKIYGIDPNSTNIEIAQQQYSSTEFLTLNFPYEGYSIKDKSVDLIQINDYQQLLPTVIEAIRKINENGMVIMKCKNENDLRLLRTFIMNQFYDRETNNYLRHGVSDLTMYLFF